MKWPRPSLPKPVWPFPTFLLKEPSRNMTIPLQGEQILQPPTTTLVTDPAALPPLDPVTVTEPLVEAADIAGPSILLENGMRVAVAPGQEGCFRVYDAQAHAYDHCATLPSGEWVYR